MYKKIEAISIKFISGIIFLYISKKYISKEKPKKPILITFIKYIFSYKYK
jgi:hypothetical protein